MPVKTDYQNNSVTISAESLNQKSRSIAEPAFLMHLFKHLQLFRNPHFVK
jgi:hypothetical protein